MTIPRVTIDDRSEDELLLRLQQKLLADSGGNISNFDDGSPVKVLLGSQVFAIAELLWYANKLPDAIALEIFRLYGVSRKESTKASGYVRFLLETSLLQNFTLPVGYQINDGNNSYSLLEPLTIVAGTYDGVVLVECDQPGSQGNRVVEGLNITQPRLNYLSQIMNDDTAITGGTDGETLPELLERGRYQVFSKDVLVSQTDYEIAAQLELGENSYVKAFPITSDKKTVAPGHIHLFATGSDRQPITEAQAASLVSSLSPKVLMGSSLWVSPANAQYIDVEISVIVDQVSETLANTIWSDIKQSLYPGSQILGELLRLSEVAYTVRSVEGVQAVDWVALDGKEVNLVATDYYSIMIPTSCNIVLTETSGYSKSYGYSEETELDDLT